MCSSDLITMPAGIITSASSIVLTMNINHSQAGDLTVTLIGPCGQSVIFNRPGGNSNGNDLTNSGNYVFSTSATATFPSNTNPITPGNYNATFSGITFPCNMAGTWTLQVRDNASNHGGDLNSWSLSVTSSSGSFTTVFSGPDTIRPTTYSGVNNSIATAMVVPAVGTNTTQQ